MIQISELVFPARRTRCVRQADFVKRRRTDHKVMNVSCSSVIAVVGNSGY